MKHRLSHIWCLASFFIAGTACFAGEHAAEAASGHITEKMTELILQLAVILCAAKVGGYLCSRFLKIPDVLGELGAGILIGPYALGPMLHLFAAPAAGATGIPVSPELYGFATFASIILLYLAGLETDLGMFLRYSVPGTMVGLGGVIVSFGLGDALAVWMGVASGYMDPAALFLGAISTATSVGITARILSEKNKLDSPEGTTILAGAVIDDVLGIIILAIVVGIGAASGSGGESHVQWSVIGVIAAKAFGFWLIATVLGMLLAKKISKGLEIFGSRATMAAMSLGLACLLAGFSEKAGLAMIIGAYIMGLSLSRADSAHELYHQLEPVYNCLVAVFFAVLGMLVNVPAMLNKEVLVFGLIYSVVAVGAKVVGCGIPAMFMGFNKLGAFRVGIGMLPRGEVALIVAGIGLSAGLVDQKIFGVAILMTLITTVVAPMVMVKIFDNRSGLQKKPKREGAQVKPISLELPNQDIAEFLMGRIVQMFQDEECYVHQVIPGELIYQIRKDDMLITAKYEKSVLTLKCGEMEREFARLVLLEALANLVNTFDALRKVGGKQGMLNQIMA
jgi:Kef-type K+ transport system membrane component KefB